MARVPGSGTGSAPSARLTPPDTSKLPGKVVYEPGSRAEYSLYVPGARVPARLPVLEMWADVPVYVTEVSVVTPLST